MKVEEYWRQREVEDRHWWYLGHRRLYSSLLDRYCPEAPGGRVLDAGCGTGGFACWLRERYRPRFLAAVDVSEEALRYCRQRGLEESLCCGVEDLPFPDGWFDLVLSLNVIYHRAVSDDQAALREMARVLALGGWLLLNLPALSILRGSHDQAVEGARRYRAGQVLEMLSRAGLYPVKVTYFVFSLLPVMVPVRLASRRACPRGRMSSSLGGLSFSSRPSPSSASDTSPLTPSPSPVSAAGHAFPEPCPLPPTNQNIPSIMPVSDSSASISACTRRASPFFFGSATSAHPRSPDLWMPPAPINRALTSLLGLEARAAARWGLPLGSSLTALAQKRGDGRQSRAFPDGKQGCPR